MRTIIVILFSLVVVFAGAQDCKVGGKKCEEDGQCCGECCFNGECVDAFGPCLSALDVCKDHPCNGEEECVVYVQPHCTRCQPLPRCKLLS